MKLYISSVINSLDRLDNEIEKISLLQKFYLLESFAYVKDKYVPYYLSAKDFLLDSGAFTVMNNKKSNFNIMEFCKKYANFIKNYNIKNFFELDIDSVFGINVYKDCLHMIQDITGKEPIRVFHEFRGIDYYIEACKRFDKLAIGGLVTGNDISFMRNNLSNLLEIANKYNCKIHGLGVNDPILILENSFYSVDSSNWSYGTRYQRYVKFNGHYPNSFDCKRKNLPTGLEVDNKDIQNNLFSLKEYIKYSEYLEQF